MRFIGVFNRDGGTFRTTDMDAFSARAREIFEAAGHSIEPRAVAGDDLLAELQRAAAEADVLIAGGGDGTISSAAGIAFRQGVPLAVVPAGTMNLFARSLHMPLELEPALEAIATGEICAADIATANGRPFVHQFSVGVHAKLVKLRETLTYRSRLGKIVASFRAAANAILNAPNFHADLVTPNGVERRKTAGISVSNNPLEGQLPHAESLDSGVLGIYIIAPLTPWVTAKLCYGALRNRWKSLPEIVEKESREVTLHFPRKTATASAVIDGELVRLAKTVELKIHPGALKVVVPVVPAAQEPEAVLQEA